MRLPKPLGALTYVITYPLILFLIRGSRRAYIAIIANGEMLVTKNWLGLHKKWRLPGGGIHKDESAESAVIREVIEELGLDLSTQTLKQIGKASYTVKPGYAYTLFTVTLAKKPVFTYNTAELTEATWVPIKELANSDNSVELTTVLQLLS